MHRSHCAMALMVLLAFIVVGVPAIAAQDATPHPFAGDPAWILYQTHRNDAEQIWLIHPDGTDDHQIALDASGEHFLPDWSPDGTKIAFELRGGETEPLYEYDVASGSSRQLFACEDPCVTDGEPVYSPDGGTVLFSRALVPFVSDDNQGGEVPSDCGLWIGDIDTGEVRQITSNTDPPCDREYNARWSPDGTQIVYWRAPYANGKPNGASVWVMDADGANARQLTDPEMFAGSPDWSSDGEWIVFSTWPLSEFQCCQVSNLYRMHPDGTGMEQLTSYPDESLRATQPRYTPDGAWIVFTAVTPETRSLWAIPAEGGDPIVIVQGGIYTHGAWQPRARPPATPAS